MDSKNQPVRAGFCIPNYIGFRFYSGGTSCQLGGVYAETVTLCCRPQESELPC